MTLPDRKYSSGKGYRFGFNGMETDDEVRGQNNSLEFGSRNIYNPLTARFNATDPDDHMYPGMSPYTYAANSPIMLIDEDGRGPIKPIKWLGYEGNLTLGIIAGLVDTIVGVKDLATIGAAYWALEGSSPLHFQAYAPWAINAREKGGEMGELVVKIFTDDEVRAKVWSSLKESMGEWWTDASFQDGEAQAGFVHGKLIFDIVSLVYGAGEINALMKGEKLAAVTVKSIRKLKPCGCFTAGTLVLTVDGSKNINEIQKGDLVWAYEESTGELELKEVTETYELQWDEIYRIYVGEEVIEVTNEHPFFIGGQWVKVVDLEVGDKLTLYDGTKEEIRAIEREVGTFTVYNFEVEDFHNYFVSNTNVLVHNGNPCKVFQSVIVRSERLKPKQISNIKKALNKGIKDVQNGDGILRPNRFDVNRTPNPTKNHRKFDGALEYEIPVEGLDNQVRILHKQVVDEAGNVVEDIYGYTYNHYDDIHIFKEVVD